MSNYAPLHCHTTYSMGDAYGTPDLLAEAMAEAGCPGGAVTEHGNAYSWIKWYKACKRYGIKPVFGVEHYIVQDRTSRDNPPPKKDGIEAWRNHHNRRYHITTLAMNAAGWAAEQQLLTAAHDRGTEDEPGGYWYKPRIDWGLLAEYGSDLIVTSGCMSSYSSQRILGNQPKQAERYMARMAEAYGDRWYLEVQPNAFEHQNEINDFCFRMHKKHGWPLMVTNDIHYPTEADHAKRTFLLGQNGMDNYDEVGTCYVLTRKELIELGTNINGRGSKRLWEAGIAGSQEILERCNAEPPTAPAVTYPVPGEFAGAEDPSLAFLKHLCKQGWTRRGLPYKKRYTRRLRKELDLLHRKQFIDQILLVWGIVDFCRQNKIMVGARGSAAGSLVCYLIGITDLDPLEFDLLFERFVDITRNDPPDIDMDIQHNRRDEVKQYMRDLYGGSSVGDICTFNVYRSRSALMALAMENDVPMNQVNIITNLLVDKDNDLVGSAQKNMSLLVPTVERHPAAKEVWDRYPALHMAADLDGMVRHTGKHAGGVVVGTGGVDLGDVCFFNQEGVWGLDKYDAEGCGFLKIDALGLTTMTCLADCRDAVHELYGEWIDYEQLSLDDEPTIQGFINCDLNGIFQFEGQTTRLITHRVKPQNFSELIDINALCRPGPMYGGATEEYIKAGHGGRAEQWPHDKLNAIVDSTRGTLLYQEQMLNIMRAGGMTWEDVTFARRCISKRLGLQEMGKMRSKFVPGAGRTMGLSEEDAGWIWDRMVTFGTYAFNKSHAAAYSRVGYWCMYMKVHYPHVFYTCFGRHVPEEKKRGLLIEFIMRGGKILPPDVNESDVSFTLTEEGIRPGLADIKGMGEKLAHNIIAHRPYDPPESVITAKWQPPNAKNPRKLLNKTQVQSLVDLGAIQGTVSRPPDEAQGELYPWMPPVGLDQYRMPSYCLASDCPDMNNMEQCSMVGQVVKRWNNTYDDKQHRVEGSAATSKYTNTTSRAVTFKILLEDETGQVFVSFRKHYEANSETLKNLKNGDWIIVHGVWVKDYTRISGRGIDIIRQKTEKRANLYVPDDIFSDS